MTIEASCEMCGDQGEMFLRSRCHMTAPLQVSREGTTVIIRCYLPDCRKEVARFEAKECPWSSRIGYDCELLAGHGEHHVATDLDGKSKVGWTSTHRSAYRRDQGALDLEAARRSDA